MFLATFRRSSGCARIIRCGRIRAMVDKVLKELSPEFNKMYSRVWSTFDSAGAVATRFALADAVLSAQ